MQEMDPDEGIEEPYKVSQCSHQVPHHCRTMWLCKPFVGSSTKVTQTGLEASPGSQRKQDPVFRWEALRQIAKESRMDLAQVVRTKEQNLEEAVRMIFPQDVPAGAQVASVPAAQLAGERSVIPGVGPRLLAENLKARLRPSSCI